MGGLEDRKPSQLMDDMMALADGHHVCFLFEFAFLEQQPEDIQLQLANDKFEDPRALAKKADALWVAKEQAHTSTPIIHKVIQKPRKPTLCYYHRKFGNKANKCTPHASTRETDQLADSKYCFGSR